MGWLDDSLDYIGRKMVGKKDGGPIYQDEIVSGGPPDRGVRKMYGDSLFGYNGYKKGGRIPKRFLGGGFSNLLGLNKPQPHPDATFKKGGRIPKRFLGGGFSNLLGLNKPAPPPVGSTMIEKIGDFMTAPMDKGVYDAMKQFTESYTGKKLDFKNGGHVKKFIR